jgi:hypothetical protein
MNKLSEIIGIFFIGLIAIAAISLLMALPTMWLWNTCLEPAVDGVNTISFWQALGLNFLFSILFKSTQKSSSKNG